MRKRGRSVGELISTLTFLGLGIWLTFEGLSLLQSNRTIAGLIGCVGGGLSIIAGFRFQIQNLVKKWLN
ncbi:MAG: hypothetical protein EBW42_09550 [Rhodobacterales bacterium]|jgi:hypothetical protein|nr:hypothetical protein [Rhodobacterales bacterium]